MTHLKLNYTSPPSFLDLPLLQQQALLTIRDNTTFLWPKIKELSQQEGNSIVCKVRVNTFQKIEDSLIILSKAGFFYFYDESVAYDEKDSKVLRIHLNRITDVFITIIVSMDAPEMSVTESKNIKKQRGKHWVKLIKTIVRL